jgi:hypothetical protein
MVPKLKAFVAFLAVAVCCAYSTVRVSSGEGQGLFFLKQNLALQSHVRNSEMSWGKASVLGETRATSSADSGATQYQSRKRDMELNMSLMSDIYQLTESVDDEVITSVVEFTDNGEIVFLKPSTEEVKKISGVWSVHNGVINLAISRTHSSKFAEFTVKNQLYGRIEEAMSTLSAVGKIFCDDLCEDLSQALKSTDTFGSFSLRRIDAHITTKRTDVEELTCA